MADHLREAIKVGAYAPGDRLVERRIAADLGVSHIPVREALARLSEEGVVERIPGRGARVRTFGLRELEELTLVRTLLEQAVAVRVYERMTAAIADELFAIVGAMRSAAGRHDRAELCRADEHFHAALWRHADHELLLELTAQLRGRVAAFLRVATEGLSDDELHGHVESHDRLVRSLVEGDRRIIGQAISGHVDAAATRIRGIHEAACED